MAKRGKGNALVHTSLRPFAIKRDKEETLKATMDVINEALVGIIPPSALIKKIPYREAVYPHERYGKETVTFLLRQIAIGHSQQQAAYMAGISPETVSAWKVKHEDFGFAVERSRALYREVMLAEVHKGIPRFPRLALDLLERHSPKDYAPTKRVEQTGSISHTHGPTEMLRNLQQQREKVDAIELPSTPETIDIKAIEGE